MSCPQRQAGIHQIVNGDTKASMKQEAALLNARAAKSLGMTEAHGITSLIRLERQ